MKKAFQSILLTLILLLTDNFSAQNSKTYLYSSDSLKGFDENSVKEIGLSKKLFGEELVYYINNSKQEFIDLKYHLKHSHENIVWKTVQTASCHC